MCVFECVRVGVCVNSCQLASTKLLELHLCPEVLVLGTFVLKHYNVISIAATNVFGCIAFEGIAERLL